MLPRPTNLSPTLYDISLVCRQCQTAHLNVGCRGKCRGCGSSLSPSRGETPSTLNLEGERG